MIDTAMPSCPTCVEQLEIDESIVNALPEPPPEKQSEFSQMPSASPQEHVEESSMKDENIFYVSDTSTSIDPSNFSAGKKQESPTETVETKMVEAIETAQDVLSTSFVASLQLDDENAFQQSKEEAEETIAKMPTSPFSIPIINSREKKCTVEEKSTCSEKVEQLHVADAQQEDRSASADKIGRASLRLLSFFNPRTNLFSSDKAFVTPVTSPGLDMLLKTPISNQKKYEDTADRIPEVQTTRRAATAASVPLKHLTKPDSFQESSFVFFFTCDDEAQSIWKIKNNDDLIQVGRIVKCMSMGDCLIQLFKSSRDSAGRMCQSKKAYVSTPHFIECSSTQLNSIQKMTYDDVTGEWLWEWESEGHWWHQKSENSHVVIDLPSQKDMKAKIQRPVPYVTEMLNRLQQDE
jgi:hypothetical protein